MSKCKQNMNENYHALLSSALFSIRSRYEFLGKGLQKVLSRSLDLKSTDVGTKTL